MRLSTVQSRFIVAIALAIAAMPVSAQYKWKTPDGKIVYSDVPPISGAQRMSDAAPPLRTEALSERPTELPFALKQAASQQPVVLYTASECGPCQTARDHLARRGVPFSERTITTQADFEALQGMGFSNNSFPAMTVGREKTVGFEPYGWDRLLTVAGYPKDSQLPAGFRQAAAEPMTQAPAQQMAVTVQTRDAAGGSNRQSAERQQALDQYRAQLQSSQQRQPEAPAMRF